MKKTEYLDDDVKSEARQKAIDLAARKKKHEAALAIAQQYRDMQEKSRKQEIEDFNKPPLGIQVKSILESQDEATTTSKNKSKTKTKVTSKK